MAKRLCAVQGCNRSLYAKGLCSTHYKRQQRTGDAQAERAVGAKSERKKCSVDGCNNLATERGWCHGHYLRYVRLGDVQADRPLSRRVNTICIVDGCDHMATTRGMCSTHRGRERRWGDVRPDLPIRNYTGKGYVKHGYRMVPVPADLRHLTNGETPVAEHRLVMAQMLGRPLLPSESVHHINGDRLDNRRSNLELWSRWQPSGQRVEDKLAWAREFMRVYAPGELLENALF